MEALAAVGLAGNIGQFIDVGYKIVKTANEFRTSGKDATRRNGGLEFVTRELKELSERLEQDSGLAGVTDDERALLRLCSECQKCSGELLTLLAKLKKKKKTRWRVWHSLRAAIRDAWKKEEKSGLERRLDTLRTQIDLQIGKLSWKETLDRLESLSATADAAQKDAAIIQKDVAATKTMVESIQKTVQDLSGGVRLSETHNHLQLIFQTPNDALSRSWRSTILDTLGQQGMDQRFTEVKAAHPATFAWLLQDPTQNQGATSATQSDDDDYMDQVNLMFTNWLRSEGGIFYIAGKPGSGKSTLMKFLCQSPKTKGYLEEWRGKDKLVFTKGFFWRHGRDDQKNFIALVRGLLYQVLLDCPELTELAFPDRWARIAEHGIRKHLDASEIQEAFVRILGDRNALKGRKLVFFIDALDEYNGRHIDLVDELRKWSNLHPTDLKICVTSREHNEFTVGFSGCPGLRIHDCTRKDISLLVGDKIDALVQKYLPPSSAAPMSTLRHTIISKAEGVFLWVHLVLNAVEDGVLEREDISGLEDRINTLPKGLDELYQHLFDSIPKFYRAQAFEFLMLTHLLSSDPGTRIPLIRYHLLNEVIDDPDFAMQMAVRDEPVEKEKLVQIRRQIYGLCRGLLEVDSSHSACGYRRTQDDGVVKFMHSTVREFLDKPHVKRVIYAEVGYVDFFRRGCMTFLATIKYGYPSLGPGDDQPNRSEVEEGNRLTLRDAAYNELFAREYQRITEGASKEIDWFPDFLTELRGVGARRFPAGFRPEGEFVKVSPVRDGPPSPVRHTDHHERTYDMLQTIVPLTHGLVDLLEPGDLENIVQTINKNQRPKMDIAWMLGFLTPPTPDEAETYKRLYPKIRVPLAAGLSPARYPKMGVG